MGNLRVQYSSQMTLCATWPSRSSKSSAKGAKRPVDYVNHSFPEAMPTALRHIFKLCGFETRFAVSTVDARQLKGLQKTSCLHPRINVRIRVRKTPFFCLATKEHCMRRDLILRYNSCFLPSYWGTEDQIIVIFRNSSARLQLLGHPHLATVLNSNLLS